MKTYFYILIALSSYVRAATFNFIYTDSAGFGFNDTTARTPINGNTGTTLGQQRRNVLAEAGRLWGVHLQSNVVINVSARFQDFGCGAGGATLASAGPFSFDGPFANKPVANTVYPVALANSLAGSDLFSSSPDINVSVNSAIDSVTTCFGGAGYYYGIDRSPTTGIDLLTVLLHELGHGLGFVSFVDESTGSLGGTNPDIFTRFIRDVQTSKDWPVMTNAERVTSAVNTSNVVWTGASVRAAASRYLSRESRITFPGNTSLAGSFDFDPAGFGPLFPTGFTGEIVLVDDGVGVTSDACQIPFVNQAALAGKVVLIDRGICTFVEKITRAQAAGAVGVIIANNVTGTILLGGDPPFPSIPSISITQDLGNQIKTQLASGSVQIQLSAGSSNAVNQGFVRLYAPSPIEQGSSISHFDSIANPNLLMEPANSDVDNTLDLTLPLFRDIGWRVNDIPIPHETYDLYAGRVFPVTSTVKGIAQDADNDGVSNFAEYAFGSNPLSAQSGPALTSFSYTSPTLIPFSYTRNTTPVDVDYTVEQSNDLTNWATIPFSNFTQAALLPPANSLQPVNVNILSSDAKKFFRVRATKLPNP